MSDEREGELISSLLQAVATRIEQQVTRPASRLIIERATRRQRRQRYRLVSIAAAVVVVAAAVTTSLFLAGGSTTRHVANTGGRVKLLTVTSYTAVPRLHAGVSPDGTGWVLTTAGLELTSDGGQSFKLVTPPLPALNITDVAISGSDVIVAGVNVSSSESSGGALLQTAYSDDAGSTWTEVTPPPPSSGAQAGDAQLVSNGESVIGMLVTDQTSANFSQGEWYSTSDGGHTWSESAAPSGGTVTEVAGELWLVGGPLNNELYKSSNLGQTWVPVTAPATASSSSMIALSVPGALSNGNIVLVTTVPNSISGAPQVSVYTSSNSGQTWSVRSHTRILPGSVGGGVVTAASVVDGTIWLGAPFGSEVVVIASIGTARPATSSDLYPTVDSISAISSSTAWAVASSSQCPSGKVSCSETSALFETTNEGASWSQLDLTASSQ